MKTRGLCHFALGASLVGLLTIGGCQGPEETAAAQDAKCRSFGAIPGTPAYMQCRQVLDRQEAEMDARRRAIFAGAMFANSQRAIAASTAVQPPVYVQPQRAVNCYTMPTGAGGVYTTCH